MKDNYKPSLKEVLASEGGFSNHPSDPGGATNYGVTQRVYNDHRAKKGLPSRSVEDITQAEVEEIYRKDYWNVVKGDDLPYGIDYSTFDAGVNSGPSRGIKWLQKALAVKVDGVIGAVTLQSATRAEKRPDVIKSMCRIRMSFLQGLTHWKVFGRGWSNRVARVEATAIAMMLTPEKFVSYSKEAIREAEDTSKRQGRNATKNGTGSVATGGGAAGANEGLFVATDWLIYAMIAVSIITAGFAVYLIWQSRHNKKRAEAFKAKAEEVKRKGAKK